jgi:hypothetical protein
MVDRDLQLRLVARIAVAFVGSLLFFLAISLGVPVVLGALAGVPDWGLEALGFRVRVLLAFVALPLLSSVLVLFAIGVRVTFGVAGPLVRFHQVFLDLKSLRISRGVRIRKNDALQQTAELFDQSLVELHDHVAQMQERCESALQQLDELIERDPQLSFPLESLQTELRSLADDVGRFELLPRAPYAGKSAAAPAAPPQLVR